jgi:hypothetical protein
MGCDSPLGLVEAAAKGEATAREGCTSPNPNPNGLSAH